MSRKIGSFDWINLGDPRHTAPYREMLIGPRLSGIQEASAFLRDRFGKLIEAIFAKGFVTEDDFIAFLQLDPKLSHLIGDDLTVIQECADDISNMLEQSQEEAPALSQDHLNRFADKLAKYNVIRMVGHFLEEWELPENRPFLSRTALVQLMAFLKEDFSKESGVVRDLYEKVFPRLENLLRYL